MTVGDRVVVVGAGLAGLRAAEAVRQAGFTGQIVLIGDERRLPYDRPPLSKAVLLTPGHEEQIGLASAEDLNAARIEILLGRAVTAIDRGARCVVLSDGERVGYDRLILATGSSLRTLPSLLPGSRGVHYLRGLDDALALREGLGRARNVAVIGAGVIGLEVAASAVKSGCSVSVIEAGPRIMARAASPPISDFLTRRHRAEGVDLRLGVTVVGVSAGDDAPVLSLSSGDTLRPDLVVVGVGVIPNDALARDCGLSMHPGGVLVDGLGASSDPAIYAAGEMAVHFNEAYGRHDRQETWAHAAAHGEHVGRSLVAPDGGFAELGSYWTDQYDITLNVVGQPIGETDVMRGDEASGSFLVFHLIDGTIAGVSAVNASRDLRAAKRLVGRGLQVDAAVLADPATDLKTLG